jgi:hypothetical protein
MAWLPWHLRTRRGVLVPPVRGSEQLRSHHRDVLTSITVWRRPRLITCLTGPASAIAVAFGRDIDLAMGRRESQVSAFTNFCALGHDLALHENAAALHRQPSCRLRGNGVAPPPREAEGWPRDLGRLVRRGVGGVTSANCSEQGFCTVAASPSSHTDHVKKWW